MENEFSFMLGPVSVSASVLTTWGIMLFIAALAGLATRHLDMLPDPLQTMLEGIVSTLEAAVLSVAPDHGRQILPFISTLWLFLIVGNLVGLIPGLHSPTRDLSVTSALAVLVFLSVHWFGIKTQGFKKYLHHYLMPSPILLPFHIISELTRTLALAIRLFGNIMSLEMAAMLILLVAGFLAPVPILMLHIIEALVQAYIFGMLALIYLAGAIQSQQLNRQE
ncbi:MULTISPECIES: F0F1 ATP synthase subunit A [Methylobacter]|jgi:F-type H+-transporting ATPase subunit a|uniref:F0F1 ATP synthase subunit A n=1 Tax=Methylobacter TaxID=429 RepID=UPI0003829F1E|nr:MULTISPECIES: F0F1 ATP synthase subunit A [Methylobacter]